jgi:hypothetical protein
MGIRADDELGSDLEVDALEGSLRDAVPAYHLGWLDGRGAAQGGE